MPKPHEVHVWTVLLSQVPSQIAGMQRLLSLEEKTKAAAFLREEDRKRYIVAHGVLREMLARYLSIPPSELEFDVNAFDKPTLRLRKGFRPLLFNLAHSGDVVLYGVTLGRTVGVDVEALRDDLNLMELAEGQFSPTEFSALRATPENMRTAAFFRCWTRKEAYLKARGEGLGFPLKQFSVAFGEKELPAVLWASDDLKASERWSVFDLMPASGHSAAVVVEGSELSLLSRPWPLGI